MRTLGLLITLIFAAACLQCGDDGPKCIDEDHDGYGEHCAAPDCDDTDRDVWVDMEAYPDVDGDGVFADTTWTICTDGTLPEGFSDTPGDDCDDTNAQASEIVQGYADVDGDGVGAGDPLDACGAPGYLPPGYSDTNTDCDDTDGTLAESMTGYEDVDGDGEASDASSLVCTDGTLPAGYAATPGSDCDDLDPDATSLASHGVLCELAGRCYDTEPGQGLAGDASGIGACAGTDCNGDDAGCAAPMIDTAVTCQDATSDCNAGELCEDFGAGSTTCWAIPGCCVSNNVDGLTCSALLDCFDDCEVSLPDVAAYASCLQFDCYETATSYAQQLWAVAQECIAQAGCYVSDDWQGCISNYCFDQGYSACVLDI